MNPKRLFSLLLVVSLWAFALDEIQAQTKKTVVRLNYSGSIYATTSVVGVEKGFFDQAGLIVNASPESSGQVALQALIGGSTDFAVGANVRPIQALAPADKGYRAQHLGFCRLRPRPSKGHNNSKD